MTGRECFLAAMNLLGEQEEGAAYYEQFACGALNQLLANCLREINALRQAAGQEALRVPPQIQALEDALEADEAMVRECFPYGLAALLICDDDREKFNWLGTEFAMRLDRHCPAAQFAVKELY
ncbi:MAG: hypothetical protein KH319_03445 [Butyricicoccus pullicaecorum]|jgi:hypothetical protein|nr:hypothetical protein [Butyricicoccus pullicaecorum]